VAGVTTGGVRSARHALFWAMAFGPFCGSITAKAARRLDRQQVGQIALNNDPQRLHCGAGAQVFRQVLRPRGIIGL